MQLFLLFRGSTGVHHGVGNGFRFFGLDFRVELVVSVFALGLVVKADDTQ